MIILNRLKKALCVLILILVIALPLSSCKGEKTNASDDNIENTLLKVTYIDVGQGDSILLQSGEESMLIDSGERQYADAVMDCLEENDINTLTYAVVTHPHSDHCGAMDEILNVYSADNFMCTNAPSDSKVWQDVLSEVKSKRIKTITASAGQSFDFGNTKVDIFSPIKNDYDDLNDWSIVMKVTCSKVSFLFTGDAEKLVEYQMMDKGYNLSSTVLKLGHHGSSTSTCEEFLYTVNPSYAVISCGKDNEYGHPHDETIELLKHYGVTYFQTDKLSSIVAETDGERVVFSNYEKTLSKSEEISVNPTEITTSQSPQTTVQSTQPAESVYMGNKNSKVFHRISCGSAKQMKEKNKVAFDSREQAINSGYSPCQICNP